MRTSDLPSTRALAELGVDECLRLLASRYVGRLGFNHHGRPLVLPVNYVLHAGAVTFRVGYGSVLDEAIARAVAFQVDAADSTYHTGWSVLVQGHPEEIWRPDELDEVRGLPLRPWAPGDREHYIRVLSTAVTGRRIG
jgi:uncharacterized protein